jgi:rod shape-determining protein MreB
MSKFGIDLGTTNTRIYKPGKGIIVDEPSVVALDASNNKIVAVGDEAKQMLGRTPDSIMAAYPLQEGVIASFRITEGMIRYYLNRVSGRFRLLRPHVMVCIPAGITSTERRAVVDACIAAGARETLVIKAPIAAALGAGVVISSSNGNLIIDIGGGTSEVAVIALGDIVASTSVRVGGKKIDQAITSYLRKKRSLIIGEQTAEQIKIKIGSAIIRKKEDTLEVSGSNTVTGLPESLILKSNEIVPAIRSEVNIIIQAVKSVLQKTPPELASDVMDRGIIMTGGSSKLRGIDHLLTKVTGVPCQIVEEPEFCCVRGTGIAAEHLNEFRRSILWMK